MGKSRRLNIAPLYRYLKVGDLWLVIILAVGIGSVAYLSRANMTGWRYWVITNQLEHILGRERLDARDFWRWRDRLGGGTVAFDTTVTEVNEIMTIISRPTSGPVIIYTSPLIISYDYLINQNVLSQFLDDFGTKAAVNLEVEADNTIVYEADDGNVRLIAWWSEEEFRRSVGFFNFTDEEKSLINDMIWVSDTTISLKPG